MMQLPPPLVRNVVLIGGGHAHALVLKSWAMKPTVGARVTVINPMPTAPYTGMLPGFVAGHYTRDELDIDLVRLARFADARLVLGYATHIDREAKTVTVEGRPPIPYDICSIDVGITSSQPTLPGFLEHAVPAKPLGEFANRWVEFLEERAGNPTTPQVVVIGGGVGGSELSMAMSYRLQKEGHDPIITVIDRSSILREVGEVAHSEIRAQLDQLGVIVRENETIDKVGPDGVHLSDGTAIPADLIVGVAGARPFPWLADLGLAVTDGFIDVGPTLQSSTDPNIFAVGDCANLTFDPRPKAGVFAVREAPYLYDNIHAVLAGTRLKKFDPQGDYLKLISLGKKSAGADKFKRFTQGPNMWRLKDRIDRKFMDKLGDLPAMSPPSIPRRSVAGLAEQIDAQPPLCGGCGAKVGVDVLAGPLGRLEPPQRGDVVRLPGDDAAMLQMGDVRQVVTTDQLRAFTLDPYRMARIATLHALGDIWAMGAKPQAVLVTVTLPQLGRGLQEEWLGEIMAGTSLALAGTGAEIVGGHTSMGAELSIGYSVTGLADGPVLTLAGANPGDRLILTRAIGSGVLFAAEMQSKAQGADIVALLDELVVPQGPAASVLAAAGATAMTDVTGFGLAGHLRNMISASGVGAELDLTEVPLFAGALELSISGVRSHLHESNVASATRDGSLTYAGRDTRASLVHDPQTAGGMLASVPEHSAFDVVEDLRRAGFSETAVIGTITAQPGVLQLN